MTEEKEKDRDKKILDEGSPITVGGGGGLGGDKDKDKDKDKDNNVALTEPFLSCAFDEREYPDPDPGNDAKKFFKRSDSKIQTLKVRKRGIVFDLSRNLPAGDCEIVVHATGTRDDVTFISQDAGNGTTEFGIDMDTRRYRGNTHTANERSHINKIDLDGETLDTFSAADDCAICVDFVASGDSKCFT